MGFFEGFLIGAVLVGGVMYFVGSNNPYKAAKDRLIAKAKSLLPILAVMFLFSSCAKNYDNAVTGRGVSQQGVFTPLTDSVKNLISAKLVYVDASHAGNPEVFDSVYTVKKTVYQNTQDIGRSWRLPVLLIGIVITVLFLFVFIKRTSSGSDSKAEMAWLLPCIVGLVMMGTSIYAFSDERGIKKSDWINYYAKYGNLETFWQTPVKTY